MKNRKNNFSRDSYFDLMRKTAALVSPFMTSIVLDCPLFTKDTLGQIVKALFQKRCAPDRPKLRPFVTVISAGTPLNERPSFAILQLAASVELLNVSTYFANLAFDGKGGTKYPNKLWHLYLASMLLHDVVFERLAASGIPQESMGLVLSVLARGYRKISEGQYIDLCHLLQTQFSYFLQVSGYDNFLSLYIKRCFLLGGGSLWAACVAGGIVGKATDKLLDALAQYGWYHGLALQVINDVADFAPVTNAGQSVGKNPSDRYADLFAGKLTLPIFTVLRKGTDSDRAFIQSLRRDSPQEDFARLPSLLQRVHAFDESVALAKAADTLAGEALARLDGPRRAFLEASLTVSHNNRFFKYFSREAGLIVDNCQANETMMSALRKSFREDHE